MEWSVRMAGRLDDMSGNTKSLRVILQPDGDVVVCIDLEGVPVEDEAGNKASVEFCNPAGGGGRSTHTRRALLILFEAMKKDAEERDDAVPIYPIGLAETMVNDKG